MDNGSTATFGSGTIGGSSSSALYFNSVSSISGSMNMATSTNTLKALYLNGGGNAPTLTLGNSLTITDSISSIDGTIATGGNLTLDASSTLRGRVGRMTDGSTTGAITGNATVKIYARNSSQNTGWALLGNGGVSGLTVATWTAQIPTTCYNCPYQPTDLDNFHSIQGWIEDDATQYNYDTLISNTTTLDNTKGFWVYLGNSSSSAGNITFSYTGPLIQGDQTANITNTNLGNTNADGWNLVCNPYSSPISAQALYNANLALAPSFELYNTQTGAIDWANLQTDITIPAGQGFYVYLPDPISSPGTLIFSESVKNVDNSGSSSVLNRTTQSASAISQFKLKINGPYDFDQTDLRFINGATSSFDRSYDVPKRFNTPGYMGTASVYDRYTSISSKLDRFYSINTLPVLTNSMTVPLVARVSITGSYSISIDNVQNFIGCTLLRDNLTGQLHDLATGPYVCTISDTTTYSSRFDLVLCQMVAPTSVKELKESLGNVQVLQDAEGAYVTTHFETTTKATISVYNIVGQQIISDLQVQGTDTTTRLNLNSHNEVLFVRITTDKESVTKKIVTH